MASTAPTGEETVYKFPPFPDPPEGVTIVPFSEFEPAGYQLATDASGASIEVDAWAGIQTVKVLNEKESAQKRKSTKKRKTAGNVVDAEGRLIPWWEEWEEGEASRRMSEGPFDSHTSLEDRVCMAADDFRVGRNWPEIAHGVRLLWDQFRLYIGLISSIPIYTKIKNKRKGQVDGPENVEEASDGEDEAPKARQVKVNVQDYLEQNALPGKQLEPNPDESTVEAQRLRAFLSDMANTVKVYLSSYMSTTGLIWSEKNLFIAPTVLHFFLRFMLRNGVFADSKEQLENLREALSVAAIAQKELPLTAKLGKVLPGVLDRACRELWGTKGSLSIQISADLSPTSTSDASCPSDSNSAFETELRNQEVEVVSSNAVLDSSIAKQVLENNLVEEYTTESWTDARVPWLMELLGPTTFPLTMTTGIVESSTRRIREVIAQEVRPGSATQNMSPVEQVLGEMYSKVVLSPWVANESADFPKPVIAPGSSGPVVAEAGPGEMNDHKPEEEDLWNPYRDDVSILVDSDVAKQLKVGMRLGGTWVQMVPETGVKKHPRECYWYVESLLASLPSYYTEGKMMEEMLGVEEEDED